MSAIETEDCEKVSKIPRHTDSLLESQLECQICLSMICEPVCYLSTINNMCLILLCGDNYTMRAQLLSDMPGAQFEENKETMCCVQINMYNPPRRGQ